MTGSVHVLATSSVPPGIRGALNQWYLEVLPGMFVGRVTSRIRDELWTTLAIALREEDAGYAVSIHTAATEQGFVLLQVGDHPYQVEDFAGLQLIARRHQTAPAGTFPGLPDPTW